MTYDRVSRLNHWTLALVMIGMLMFGLYLEFAGLEREARRPLVGIHASFGVLVLVIGTWRVAWRILRGFPDTVSDGPRWQTVASRWVHWSLLAGILLMPLSGIGRTVFRGRAVDVFGWFSIPAAPEVRWLASLSSSVHYYVGFALCLLVAVHIAAALKHHFIDQDATLTRMVSGRSPKPDTSHSPDT